MTADVRDGKRGGIDLSDPRVTRGVRELMEQVLAIAADYGPDVEEAVRLAAAEPLDEERARPFYERIVSILRGADRDDLDDATRSRLAADVKSEVDKIVTSVPRPPAGPLRFHKRFGLEPHDVTPVPIYNGMPIPMFEGYVDVEDLPLWRKNHRLELYVREFRERNGRDPDQTELLGIMQGKVYLPSLDSKAAKDPFKLELLARSIARKGIERPPIVTWEGEPKDGNRRIAAAKYVLQSPEFSIEEKERARWVRVWRMPKGTTDDQIEAIVVSLNFEQEYKEPWPEYVKARLVVERYDTLRGGATGRFTEAQDREIKREVAKQFAIKLSEVTRYLRMVRWAEDFEQYHVEEAGRDAASVRYKANDIFQWFYEIEAGRGEDKLTHRLDSDDELKRVVYDLMFDTLDAGHEVRNLYRVVGDQEALGVLLKAHDTAAEDKKGALDLVKEAISVSQRNSPTKRKIGFDEWLRTAVDRLGGTPPDHWKEIDTDLLRDLQRVFQGALGSIQGELASRASASAPTQS